MKFYVCWIFKIYLNFTFWKHSFEIFYLNLILQNNISINLISSLNWSRFVANSYTNLTMAGREHSCIGLIILVHPTCTYFSHISLCHKCTSNLFVNLSSNLSIWFRLWLMNSLLYLNMLLSKCSHIFSMSWISSLFFESILSKFSIDSPNFSLSGERNPNCSWPNAGNWISMRSGWLKNKSIWLFDADDDDLRSELDEFSSFFSF